VKQLLPQFFGLLPKADLVVKRVEAFREQPGAAQFYEQGTPDGSRPGVYYVHLIDMKAMPKPERESIAYHEGLPGHHLQISIAQELEDMPEFRKYVGYTGFVEGWGLYSEGLGTEMGRYEVPTPILAGSAGSSGARSGLSSMAGLHAKGWTEEQAVGISCELADGRGPDPLGDPALHVLPGQATAYRSAC
jgi:uncharacterized protein (DUF885 family)